MAKQVTVAVKIDSHFVSILNASVELNQLRHRDQLTPIDQLALLVLAEARGAFPEEVHAITLHEWRPHIEVLHDMRKVDVVENNGWPLNKKPSGLDQKRQQPNI